MSRLVKLNVVGLDPSMNNWGICKSVMTLDPIDLRNSSLEVKELSVICPVKPTGKTVRSNSKDLDAAQQLAEGTREALQGAHVVFVEVPVGSQNARAMAGFGICVGVLGSMRAFGLPFSEVTPTEVKMAATGTKTASKDQMIAWARARHPEGNWPMYLENGVMLLSKAKAEHMADAIGAIYAGVRTTTFQQLLPMLIAKAA